MHIYYLGLKQVPPPLPVLSTGNIDGAHLRSEEVRGPDLKKKIKKEEEAAGLKMSDSDYYSNNTGSV